MTRAVLLVSHGTVDDLDELPAFVTRVRRGRAPSPELVAELARRYRAIGGASPLNAVSAELARKLERRLAVPVAWANRLWKPFVRDVLSALAGGGVRRVALVPLAQHSAHVYAEDAAGAAAGLGVELSCAPNWGRNDRLSEAFAGRIVSALDGGGPSGTTVLMTAHSLPLAVISRGDPYEREVRASAAAIAAAVERRVGAGLHFAVAFQSQGAADAGPGGKPIEWLGPDLRAALDACASRGDRSVILAPVGFLADHVEILYDLDVEARALADQRGLRYRRAASLNAGDDLVEVLADVARPLLADG